MKIKGHEEYTLTLKHEYVNDDGTRVPLDDPIVTAYALVSEVPQSVVINEVLERMKYYVLHLVERSGK